MSKLKSKFARRIMAIVLSGAMVMSNMSAYAAELAPETAIEEVSEAEQLNTDDGGGTDEGTPSGGSEESSPAEGGGSTPEEGGESTPAEGGESTPEEGGESTPAEGGESTPAPEESSADETSDNEESSADETSDNEESSADETSDNEESSADETSADEESSEVETSTEEEEETYTFTLDPADLVADFGDYSLDGTALPETVLPSGMIAGTDVYFNLISNEVDDPETADAKVPGSVKLRQNGKNYFFIELSRASSGKIEFTVDGTATVKVEAASTGGSNWSAVGLVNSQGDPVNEKSGETLVKGTSKKTFEYEIEEPGTYALVSPYRADGTVEGETSAVSTKGRGARVISLQVVETTSERESRAAFSGVAAPKVTSAALNAADETKIDVKVEGLVGFNGGDKVTLVMTDADNKEVGKWVSRVSGNEHSFSIKPDDSVGGTVTLTAKLSRSGETDKTGTETKEVEYNAPVKAPTNLQIEDKSEGSNISIDFSWDAAAKATGYNVTVKEDVAEGSTEEGKVVFGPEKITETKVTVSEGLEQGKTYVFSVASVKSAEGAEDEVSESVERKYKIPAAEVSGGTTVKYTFDVTKLPVGTDQEEIPAGTTLFDYFKVVTDTIVGAGDGGADLVGKVIKRNNSASTAVTSVQVEKYRASAIQFEVTGTADVTIEMSSTGGSNSSAVGLVNASGDVVANNENIATVSGTGRTKMTYSDLPAGVYRVMSPGTSGDGMNRGARLYTIEVNEFTSGAAVTTEHTYDSTKLPVGTDQEEIPAGTTLFDYFKVITDTIAGAGDGGADLVGKVIKRNNSGNTAVTSVQVEKYRASAIQFEVTGTADVTIEMSSTGGSNSSAVGLINASGDIIDNNENIKTVTGTSRTKMTYNDLPAGTYRVVSPGTPGDGMNRGARLYTIVVLETTGGSRPPRADWSTVAAPEITSIALNPSNANNINVSINALIGYDGGDQATVVMKNAEGEEIGSQSAGNDGSTHTVVFTPEASGTYTFTVSLSRRNEEDKPGAEAKTFDFVLPLAKTSISRATNDGSGGIEIAYSAVPEAEKYVATATPVTMSEDGKTGTPVEGAQPITAESVVTENNRATTATLTGLTAGQYYAFTVHAVRGEESAQESDPFYKIVKEVKEQVWDYAVFGESASTDRNKCYYDGDANDGEVTVYSLNGSGKIVPASTDGLSFYYTKIDKDTNFVLEATAYVDEWTYSNGQEGFGLMVADAVGEIEPPKTVGTKFWNNSYMAVATKMEYYWNGSTVLPTTVGAGEDRVRYNMYLGLGSLVRTGVTDEWKAEEAAGATIPSRFVSEQLSLEHEAASQGLPGGGNYNVIGSRSGGTAIDVEPLLTEIKLRIEKNNTGYFITYIDKNGEETTHKYYDEAIYTSDYANQTLLQIDKENIYAGFFAARNAKVTFKDITFTTSSVADGGAPEEKPTTYNAPSYTILSGSVSNRPEYNIDFSANWNGTLSIKDSAGRELVNEEYFEYLKNTQTTVLSGGSYVPISMLDKFFEYETKEVTEKDENGNDITKNVVDIDTATLKADVKVIIPINDDVNAASKLAIGGNQFTVTFTPDRTWHRNDDELQMLSSYDTSVQTLNVSYRQYGEEGTNLYVSPDGKASGDGTKEAPLDIFTAVKYAQAGQTIVLLKGTYSLKKPLTIERGVDGTAEKPIRMIAEPGTYDRTKPFEPGGVVIDFNGVASGMTLAGDYWYLRGFDVKNSSDGDKGIQVSGSYNVLDQINTYYNGNTGIQISRYKGGDIDKSDDWPAHNRILNCTSYLNADSGHEDADGFAAKLTIGDGNEFDGCIGAYNADDGWDFFAKSESGPIGQVIIKNSVAYRNGYLITDANGNLDVNGTEMMGNGNGNGFKMGGENIRGYHMVMNSYAFLNKSNGIDCNSCPDIQVYNCISYNNGGIVNGDAKANVRFQSAATQTAFKARNLISFKTEVLDIEENLKPVTPSGATDLNDYKGASNYYWDAGAKVSKNEANQTVTTDWFKSLDYNGITTVSRNTDGTINMGNFLALSSKADTSSFVKLKESTNDAGATIFVTAEGEEGINGLPGIGGQPSDDANAKPSDKDTSGNIVSGDDDDLSSNDTWTDEEFAQLDVNGTTLKILLDLDYNRRGYYTDYTGLALKPAVRVAYGPNELSSKNYSVSYKNNTKAYELRPGDEGFDAKLAPTVVIKGKGNYSGEYKLYFVINKVDLSSNKVTSADIATIATGKSQKINPVVTFDGKKLGAKDYTIGRRYTVKPVTTEDGTETGETEEADYTGSYESAGTYYIELNAVDGGNFEGTKTITVKALSEEEAAGKTPMSKVKVDKIPDQIYDGTAHCPVVTVKDLTASTTDADGNFVQGDYDVAYYNNTDIGVASVVLTGNLEKGYYGTKTVTFKTVAKPFNVKDYSVSVKGTFDGQTYEATTDEQYKSLQIPSSGSAITFSNVVVKVIANEGSEDVRLTEGVDYTVSYRGNTKAGAASIVIKGMGDFKGSMTRSFKITPYEINESNTTVEPIADQTYVKGGVKPSVIVKVNGKVVSAKNYTVGYKNNNKVGTATVSITGRNLLKGSLKDVGSFEINAKNLRSTNIVADNVYYGTAKNAGDGIAYLTKLAVKDGNKTLSLNSDYTVTYYEEDGTPVFNYNTGELKFRKTVTVENEDGTTKEEVQEVSATPLEKNSKITYDGSNKTIYAVITGGKNGLYTGASFASYKVVGKNDIKTAKITRITDIYTYNDGSVAAPKLEVKIQNRHLESGKYVKDAELTTLKLNEDYEITNLKNNDRAGTCTITIKGMGYYSGTNKVSFKIAKKDLSSWNAYLSYTTVENIVVNVNEDDLKKGGSYEFLTTDGVDDEVFGTAAKGKIYVFDSKGNKIELQYGEDYSVTEYTNNKINVSGLTFDEAGYAEQTATATIKGEGNYTGSRTIRFTIRVKRTTTV